jgi:AcrR family transcriptional regulator
MALRSETSRQAVLDATMALLGDRAPGPVSVQRLTIEAIAKQAGVGKATIYRWWPNKAAVVIDSFVDYHVAATPVDAAIPVEEALRAHVRSLVRLYDGPEGRLVAQIIAECQYDPDTLAEFRHRFWDGRALAVRALIERGIAEGVLRDDVDATAMAEVIYSPIYQRLLFRTGTLDDEYADRLVETTLGGLRPRK